MKDRALIIVGIVIVLAIAIWLIRSEGERFRQSMRESADESIREGMREAAEGAVDQAADEAEGLVDKAADRAGELLDKATEAPGEILGDIKGTITGEPAKPSQPSESTRPRGQEDTATVSDPGTAETETRLGGALQDKTEASPPSQQSPEKTADAEAPTPVPKIEPAELVGDLFRLGREATKVIDDIGQEVLSLSVEEERKFGREVHDLIRREYKLVDTRATKVRLQRLANPLLEERDRKDIQYQFFVIEDEEVNAFAHLGGYVYVTTGLLKLVKTDAELQFVLGHEIAHVDLKHCVRSIAYAAAASEVAGEVGSEVVQLAYLAISLGYSEDQEFEADMWSFKTLRSLGQTRSHSVAFLERMLQYEREHGRDVDNPKEKEESVADTTVREIENHFRSHPPTRQRIDRLESAISGRVVLR